MIRSVLHLQLVLAAVLLLGQTHAFHPPSMTPASSRNSMVYPARSVQGAHYHHRRQSSLNAAARRPSLSTLKMSSDGDEEQTKAVISPDGTFYDDEVDSAPEKEGISDSMRARLMKEASTGLDSDAKQTNVLLIIIGVVAVLVVLGGAGIFY